MSTNSSDGRVQVDIHAAYASALIYVNLTAVGSPSSITIYRNGIAMVTQDNTAGTAVWYDHFPPYGSVSYTATANGGAITTTAATVTIAAPTDGRVWLKSTDPNLSMLVHAMPLETVRRPKDRGIFRGPNARFPVILEGPVGGVSFVARPKVYLATDRDRLLTLWGSGPIYWQPPSCAHQEPRWLSLGDADEDYTFTVADDGMFVLSMQADEIAPPTLDPTAVVIPGWGWTQVAAAYATWNATTTAKTSWIALLRQGVGA